MVYGDKFSVSCVCFYRDWFIYFDQDNLLLLFIYYIYDLVYYFTIFGYCL